MARYQNRDMERLYVEMQAQALQADSELYHRTQAGRLAQRTGAGHRSAFWRGFAGEPPGVVVTPGTLAWACYQAGKTFARNAPDWVPRS